MRLVMLLAVIMSFAIVISRFFKYRIEKTVPMVCFAYILILYISGLMGNLLIGAYFCLGIGFLSTGFCLYLSFISFIKFAKSKFRYASNIEKEQAFWLNYILTPGLAVFSIFTVVFVWYYQIGRLLTHPDMFTHWGTVVKHMYFYHTFSDWHISPDLFPGYPPAVSLFEYLWTMVYPVFREDRLFSAFNFLEFSFMLPAFGLMTWKRNKRDTVCLFVLLLVVCRMFYDLFSNLVVDPLLGLAFAYCLFTYYNSEKKDYRFIIELGMGLSVLTLSKESGLGLAMIAVLIMTGDVIFIHIKNKNTLIKDWMKSIKIPAALILFIVVSRVSWVLHLKISGKPNAWSSVKISHLMLYVQGKATEARRGIPSYFWSNVKLSPLSEHQKYYGFPVLVLFIAFIGFGLLLLKRIKDPIQKERNALAILSVAAGWVIYIVGLLLQYMVTFSEREGAELAAYWRYMGTYALGAFVFMIIHFCRKGIFPVILKERSAANVLIVLFMLCLVPYIKYYFDLLLKIDYDKIIGSHADRANYDYIERALPMINSGESLLHLTSETTDISILLFNAMPVIFSTMTTDDFTADNCSFHYIYLHDVNEQFVRKYEKMFKSESGVTNGLYQVVKGENGTIFIKVMNE